jgi:hypothetical protein
MYRRNILKILYLSYLLLNCGAYKAIADEEDEWKNITSIGEIFDEIIGEWYGNILSSESLDIPFKVLFYIDENQNKIFDYIMEYESFIDNVIYDLRTNYRRNITKDEFWEIMINRLLNSGKYENDNIRQYVFEKYFVRIITIINSNKDQDKNTSNDRFMINNSGNKIKIITETDGEILFQR